KSPPGSRIQRPSNNGAARLCFIHLSLCSFTLRLFEHHTSGDWHCLGVVDKASVTLRFLLPLSSASCASANLAGAVDTGGCCSGVVKCILMRCTPVRCTFMRCTPVRYR